MLHVPSAGLYEGRVDVSKFGSRFEVRTELGNVQPGSTAWSKDSFYIGARIPQTVKADLAISANNLRTPMTMKAEIEIEVASEPLQILEIICHHAEEE